MEIAYLIFAVISGAFVANEFRMTVSLFLWSLLDTIMIITLYASIFNAIVLFCDNMTLSTILCFAFFAIMFFFSCGASSVANEPEYVTTRYYDETGNYTIVEREETDLSRKIKKEICKVIYNIIPSGQAMQITTNKEYGTNIAMLIIYATIEIIIINKIGIYFFNKKEIS